MGGDLVPIVPEEKTTGGKAEITGEFTGQGPGVGGLGQAQEGKALSVCGGR